MAGAHCHATIMVGNGEWQEDLGLEETHSEACGEA